MSSLRYQSPAAIKESGHFLRMLRNLPLSQASRIGRSYIASTLQGLVDAINPVAPFQRPQAHRRPRQDCQHAADDWASRPYLLLAQCRCEAEN
jgi:hypothetical protein